MLLIHWKRLRHHRNTHPSSEVSSGGRRDGGLMRTERTETIQEVPTALNEKIPLTDKRDKLLAWHFYFVGSKQLPR